MSLDNSRILDIEKIRAKARPSETYEDVQRALSSHEKEELYRSFGIRRALDFATLYNQPVCSTKFE